MEVITRAEAKKAGLRHYFTGKPCAHGHMDKRFTSIGKCMECARQDAMRQHVHTTPKRRKYSNQGAFIAAATALHNGRYSYELAQYKGAHQPLAITCPEHGVWMQTPTNHMQKKGCPACATAEVSQCQLKPLETFVAQAVELWGDAFDYANTTYRGARVKLSFVCKRHGAEVLQTPDNHLEGKNPCPQCNHMKSSGEEEVRRFLSIFTTVEARNRTLIKPREVDMYLPEKKLAVEYCGMYWHSHHDADDERKNRHKHFEKYTQCQEQGVRLLTIYETEWAERGPAIRRLLRNAIGKSRGKLMARKCDLRTVSDAEARAFYEKYHPQGGDGSGEHYALFWKGKMVACMRFVFGANDRGAGASSRSWTLGRYATRVTVAGAASRLFNGFLTDYYHPSVKSFSDNRYFSGGMYEQLGFVLEEEVAPDYRVWSPKIGLRPKSHYQRRLLPKRLQEHGAADSFDPKTDPRTEREMTYLMGCGRVYDCGKKRWVWTR